MAAELCILIRYYATIWAHISQLGFANLRETLQVYIFITRAPLRYILLAVEINLNRGSYLIEGLRFTSTTTTLDGSRNL